MAFFFITGIVLFWLLTVIERSADRSWGVTETVKQSGKEAINIILVIDERMLDVFNRRIF